MVQHLDSKVACLACHTKGDASLKPATHTNEYLDSHTREREKADCAVCHGRKFRCLGCHN